MEFVVHKKNKSFDKRVYNFSDCCRDMRITLQDGLKMFIPTNIFVNKIYTKDTPCMCSGLHLPPYRLTATSLPPENIRVTLAAKQEMSIRIKRAHPTLKCYLSHRFNSLTHKKRSRLAAYVGVTDEFSGIVCNVTFITHNNNRFADVIIRNVVFAMVPNDIITEYIHVLIPIDTFRSLRLNEDDIIIFTGIVHRYSRYNPEYCSLEEDYTIGCLYSSPICKK